MTVSVSNITTYTQFLDSYKDSSTKRAPLGINYLLLYHCYENILLVTLHAQIDKEMLYISFID